MKKTPSHTILLVEDEPVTSLAESRMLRKHGYTVVAVSTGEEAVETALSKKKIDIILMDIDLGNGIDGTQAAEKILGVKNIPIIFLSSHTEQEIVDKTEKITSYGYVVKDSGETILLASIRMAFRLHEAYLLNQKKSEELEATNEEMEATNEELQTTMEELIGTNEELENLLRKHEQALRTLREHEYFLNKSQEIGKIGSFILEMPEPEISTHTWRSSSTLDEIVGIDESYPRDAVSWMKLIVEPEKVMAHIRDRVFEKKGNFDLEYKIKRHDNGEIRWIHGLGEPVLDDQGTVIRMIGTGQDITEQKLAQETIRKSEEKLFLVFDNSPNAITITDMETGMVIEANRGIQWTGWTLKELIGKNPQILQSWVHPGESENIRDRLRTEGRINDYRIDFYKKDGTIAHGLLNSVFINLNGKEHLLTLTSDITMLVESETRLINTKEELQATNEELNAANEEMEAANEELISANEELEQSKNDLEDLLNEHKKALKELEEKQYFLQRSQKIARIGSFSREYPGSDLKTQVSQISPTFYDIFGIDESDILDSDFLMALYLDPDKISEFYMHLIRNKKKFFTHEYQIKRNNDGEIRWISASGEILYDDQGTLVKIFGTVQDITEQKLALESLKKSEGRYRAIFEGTATANIITAADTTIMLANDRFSKLIGYSRTELEGRMSWTEFVLAEDLEKMKRYHLQRRQSDGVAPDNYEFRGKDRAGTILDLYMSVAMIPGTDESIASIIDITSLRQAEQELRKNEERFRNLTMLLPETVFETNLHGNLTFVNQVSFKRFGYTPEDISRGLNILDFIAPQDHEKAVFNIEKIKEGETPGLNEYTLKRKDGSLFPSLIHTIPIINNDQVIGFMGFLVDITERKLAEKALKESEERWQFALEGAGDGVWDWNLQTDEIYFSRQWKAMLGFEEDEINNMLVEWESRVHPDDLAETYKALDAHIKGKTPVYMHEFRMKCKNGGYLWILDRGKIIRHTPEGRPLRFIGTHTDITTIKKTEETLEKLVSEKQSLLKELQHRIKNSLSLITSIIELETSTVKTEDTIEVLNALKWRIQSLANLYSHLFTSETVSHIHLDVYLQTIVQSLTDTYGTDKRKISIEEQYSPVISSTKDATAWGLIVNELLINALKYAFPKDTSSQIKISLNETDSSIELAVSDNGPGPPSDFDIYDSAGFGLIMVHALTDQLGGEFSFKRNRENTFSIRIEKPVNR